MSSTAAAGWYGKLASLGDFAQRRLPADFVATSDAWLSQGLQASRQQLGDHWLDVYLTAPLMRFGWAPGVAGAGWWFGVLMPSCDNVGRYFPLLIAQSRPRPPLDRIALDHLELWFDHLAHAATQTLDEQPGSIETFEAALADAPPWPAPAPGAAMSAGTSLLATAIQELQARVAGCSIWWRVGEAGQAGAVDIVHGLPSPTDFARMLTGR